MNEIKKIKKIMKEKKEWRMVERKWIKKQKSLKIKGKKEKKTNWMK